MITSRPAILALGLALAGQACRSPEAPPSGAAAQVRAGPTPPAVEQQAPLQTSAVAEYEISDDALRRATSLTRAVLVRLPSPGDAMAAVFGESGVRFARLGSGSEGFVTEYAMSEVAEDKAEMFRFLALAPTELSALAQRDRTIANKRELLLRRLAQYCAGQTSRIVCNER